MTINNFFFNKIENIQHPLSQIMITAIDINSRHSAVFLNMFGCLDWEKTSYLLVVFNELD